MRAIVVAVLLSCFCGLAGAGADVSPLTPAGIAGRWHSDRIWMLSAKSPECSSEEGCGLTLDIVACGNSWCGIEVGRDDTCGGVSLKFETEATNPESADVAHFSGTLELARGTEPYVVKAHVRPASADGPSMLSMTGDTGGEFRLFRRTFPFHATLVRTGDARCKLEKPVS